MYPKALDGLSFDPFSFKQDGLAASEVDVGRGEISDALMVSPARVPAAAIDVARRYVGRDARDVQTLDAATVD
jgi:hypothetical protein